jgi:hypothetical protein
MPSPKKKDDGKERIANAKKNGSRGRARTFNITVNSRVLYH